MSTVGVDEVLEYVHKRVSLSDLFSDEAYEELQDFMDDARTRAEWEGDQRDLIIAGEPAEIFEVVA